MNFLLALLVIMVMAPSGTHAAEPTTPPDAQATLTPAQARHTLSILQDDAKRAELEQTLNAIALAGAGTAPVAAATVPAPEEDAPVALTQGGLLDQLLGAISQRLTGAADWVRSSGSALGQVRDLVQRWQESLDTPEQKKTLLLALVKAAFILAAALCTEWLLKRALKRGRDVLTPAANRTSDAAADGKPPEADRYSSLLRRIPYALGQCVLNLLPLLGFLAVASVLASVLSDQGSMLHDATLIIVAAYVTTRLALAILALFVLPGHEGLRLMHISTANATLMYRWFSWIVVIAVFGIALANLLLELGASRDLHQTMSKFVALIVHVLLLIMVWRNRRSTAAAIRGTPTGSPGLFGIRRVLADVWPVLASVFIVGVWLLWSAGTPDGFQRLVRLFAWSAVVIVAAGLLSIFILGVVDRAFSRDEERSPVPAATTERPRNLYRSLVHRVIYIIIAIVTGLVLLQVWGFDAWAGFREGSVGRRLASAAITIAITCALAAIAWESLNTTISRRLDRWRDAGEFARAARLRTLVPMIRTALFVVIAMVVLLTALSQLGVTVAPLLAGASIIGVALGFGSQKLVQDFITGIFLLMENAMQVGDWVTVAGLSGSVEYLSIRTVRLRAGDGALHVVPFSAVSTVTNTNRGLGNASVRVSVTADSNVDEVFNALKTVGADLRADPKFKDLILADLDIWGVDQVDGNMITVAGQIRTLDKGRWPVQREFNRRILQCFRERDIRLVNPKETMVVNAG
ncbi:mechanosensitive ion channel domain-containing protein [Pollutimonas subterranea]|nr:mechanosensitive ion channel domain-containing protein [Pollutimonas subterranea]